MSIGCWRSKRIAKRCKSKIDQLNQQANAVSKSIGQAKDPAEREARKEEGRKLREQVTATTDQLKLVTDEADGDSADDSESDASRCADRRRRCRPRNSPRQNAAAEIQFQAARSRGAWRKS